ncbi:MAG: ATP-dependent helicase, partial [Rikenellaceae bacterium]
MQTLVDISYDQTGKSSSTDAMGMREMQRKAYEAREHQYILLKAPPASGKSRALMFLALDKTERQGLRKCVVAVPEKTIGRSFQNTDLKKFGFFADWRVA